MIESIMPFIVGIVLIVTIGIVIIVTRALAYREKIEMLNRGYVPKGYQPSSRSSMAQQPPLPSQPADPSALPPAPWNAQQWGEGVPTSRYVGELAKDDVNRR